MASFIGTTSTDPGVDLKTNNKIGLGTDSPAQKVDVRDGYAQIKHSTGNAGLYLDAATNRDPFVDFKVNGTLKQNIFFDGSDNCMKICEQNTTVHIGNSSAILHIGSGQVGIGTTSPNTNLEVCAASGNATVRTTAPSGSSPQLEMYEGLNIRVVVGYAQAVNQYGAGDGVGDTVIRAYQEDRYIRFGDCNGHVMSVGGSDASVGVGTTSPVERLEVNGNAKIGSGGYNNGHLRLGNYHLWVDSTGDLRIKSSTPTSDTDGTVVGTQS